ncbi:unnamed protein product [Ceutorhynchus assimilis]|uniref:RRM domain-containing protein n=1 Tax=Ceutorhynchus assimilis TaxID=467358 RepID=A0A9N9MG10_9CUCU|nr:unnamed protein product [Ceutorhynchus assimilis]
MDIGVYREDEQFTSSAYVVCPSNSTSFQHNALFGEIRPMPQPPNEIFEWPSDGDDRTVNTDASDMDDVEYIYAPTEYAEDDHEYTPADQQYMCMPKYVPDINQISSPVINNVEVEQLPVPVNYIRKKQVRVIEPVPTLQEILDLPEIKDSCDPYKTASVSEFSEGSINTSSSRRESESSDLLNTSFSSTDFTNFDITKYIFEEDKQAQKVVDELLEIKIEPVSSPGQEFVPNEYALQNIKIEPQEPPIPKIGNQKHAAKVFIKEEPEFEKKNIIPAKRVVKAAVKKIDLKAKKYIVDDEEEEEEEEEYPKTRQKTISEEDCDVDIETVTEGESSLILEAGNLTDLLHKFEASEERNKDVIGDNKNRIGLIFDVETGKDEAITTKRIELKVDKKTEIQKPSQKNKKIAEPEKIEQPLPLCTRYTNNRMHVKPTGKATTPPTSFKTSSVSSNKQNINSLPQELINRIKESGKRKPITVIDPVPNFKKRMKCRNYTLPVIATNKTVILDHSYCIENSSGKKLNGQKCKEDSSIGLVKDEKTVLNHQPNVIDVLKANSDNKQNVDDDSTNQKKKLSIEEYKERKNNVTPEIQFNTCTVAPKNQKRKLNLEEYNKRRNGIITPKSQSLNCSPSTSTCSSPSPEDDYQKMLKHQQKLKKMAEELLKAAPKSEKKTDCGSSPLPQVCSVITKSNVELKAINNNNDDKEIVDNIKNREVKLPKLPPNLERKILVSCGVNTDLSIAKNEDPLAPIENLMEMKPLLEKVSNKINGNSLILSVMETVPILIDRNAKKEETKSTMQEQSLNREHGEHKKIIYLEKDRLRPETRDAKIQTNISLIDKGIRRIRKVSSSSESRSSYTKSRSSGSSRRSRVRSDSSCSSTSSTSRSSSSSSYSSGMSRSSSRLSYSRSRSPAYRRTRRNSEHLNAVEERRIIYVGKINSETTKKELRRKFQKFGPINRITLHFREIGENYGFVTFKYKEDAHAAYEHGNDDLDHAYYKISFGGRRDFCKSAYSDLDNVRDDSYYPTHSSSADADYDQLLQEALKKLKKRNA